MTTIDLQNFTALLESIAQRRIAGGGTVSAQSSAHVPIPEVRSADIPQEVKDAVEPSRTGMRLQLAQTGGTAVSDARRVFAGDISVPEFADLINQLADSAKTQVDQQHFEAEEKLKALGQQHPAWRQTVVSVFNAISNLMGEVLDKELGFLLSLPSNLNPQASRKVEEFFSGVVSDFDENWDRILG